jgi:hypothetical protein
MDDEDDDIQDFLLSATVLFPSRPFWAISANRKRLSQAKFITWVSLLTWLDDQRAEGNIGKCAGGGLMGLLFVASVQQVNQFFAVYQKRCNLDTFRTFRPALILNIIEVGMNCSNESPFE